MAIAVDNLADAESLTAIEKDEEEEEEELVIKTAEELEEDERKRKIRKLRRKRRKRRMALTADSQDNGGIRLQTLSIDSEKKSLSKTTSDESEYDEEDFDDMDDDMTDDESEDDLELAVVDNDIELDLEDPNNIKALAEYTGARPRRLSEINVAKKTPPIPKYSSFFIFSHTNR